MIKSMILPHHECRESRADEMKKKNINQHLLILKKDIKEWNQAYIKKVSIKKHIKLKGINMKEQSK